MLTAMLINEGQMVQSLALIEQLILTYPEFIEQLILTYPEFIEQLILTYPEFIGILKLSRGVRGAPVLFLQY